MAQEWGPAEFDARLREADRVVVLFHAEWCAASRAFLDAFERADVESSVPMVRADLAPEDPRWDEHRIRAVPTVAYFEHGEELERVAATRAHGLPERAFARFMDDVEALQERLVRRGGRLRVDRFG